MAARTRNRAVDERPVSRRGFVFGSALAGSFAATGVARAARDPTTRAAGGQPLVGRPNAADAASPNTAIVASTRGVEVNGAVALEEDGAEGIWSWTDSQSWASSPPMRLRVSRSQPDPSSARHFLITPYRYGVSLEYPGVIEMWAHDVSVHNHSPEQPIQPARLWVGNHDDTGGMLLSATNSGGSRYAEMISQLFTGASGGDLRLTVREPDTDSFDFRAGRLGNEASALRVSGEGQLQARFGQASQVELGAVGPTGEAGVTFGPGTGVRLFVSSSGRLVADAVLVARRGLAVGNAEPARRPRQVIRRIAIFDEKGQRLGFVPVYDRIDL